jgi:hypothetical protein
MIVTTIVRLIWVRWVEEPVLGPPFPCDGHAAKKPESDKAE